MLKGRRFWPLPLAALPPETYPKVTHMMSHHLPLPFFQNSTVSPIVMRQNLFKALWSPTGSLKILSGFQDSPDLYHQLPTSFLQPRSSPVCSRGWASCPLLASPSPADHWPPAGLEPTAAPLCAAQPRSLPGLLALACVQMPITVFRFCTTKDRSCGSHAGLSCVCPLRDSAEQLEGNDSGVRPPKF